MSHAIPPDRTPEKLARVYQSPLDNVNELHERIQALNGGPRYEYRVFFAHRVIDVFRYVDHQAMPDAYLSHEADTAAILQALVDGFRWVRTEHTHDNDYAVFEKQVG